MRLFERHLLGLEAMDGREDPVARLGDGQHNEQIRGLLELRRTALIPDCYVRQSARDELFCREEYR
jgi:hypothetical protein